MKVTRSMFRAYRQHDAQVTAERNSRRKLPERARRDARMLARVKADSLPYTPDVMSWLSAKLDKPSTKITQDDVRQLIG